MKIKATTRGKTTPSKKSTPSILAIIFSIYILLLFTIVHTSIYHFSLSECIRQVLFYCSKLANRAHAWLRLVSLRPITSRDVMGLRCPQAFAWGRELFRICRQYGENLLDYQNTIYTNRSYKWIFSHRWKQSKSKKQWN